MASPTEALQEGWPAGLVDALVSNLSSALEARQTASQLQPLRLGGFLTGALCALGVAALLWCVPQEAQL